MHLAETVCNHLSYTVLSQLHSNHLSCTLNAQYPSQLHSNHQSHSNRLSYAVTVSVTQLPSQLHSNHLSYTVTLIGGLYPYSCHYNASALTKVTSIVHTSGGNSECYRNLCLLAGAQESMRRKLTADDTRNHRCKSVPEKFFESLVL